jgi:hypothetical protein
MKQSLPRVLDKGQINNMPSYIGLLQRIVSQQFSSNDSVREVFLQVFDNWLVGGRRTAQARKESCPMWNLSVRQFRDTPNSPLTASLVEVVCHAHMLERWWKAQTPGSVSPSSIHVTPQGHFRPEATHRGNTLDGRASNRFTGLSNPVMDFWGIVKGALLSRAFSSVDAVLLELKSAVLRGLQDSYFRRVMDFSRLTLEAMTEGSKKRPRIAYDVVLNADGTERARPTWFIAGAIGQSTNGWQLQRSSEKTDEYGVSSRAIQTTWEVKKTGLQL